MSGKSTHFRFKHGGIGRGRKHAAYIVGVEKYATREDVAFVSKGNMPAWADADPLSFWDATDKFERANGRTYNEFEGAIPRELNLEQAKELSHRWIAQELGKNHPYLSAIHVKRAADGLPNVHLHAMFSDRIMDGVDRPPELFFKRVAAPYRNRKTGEICQPDPSKGGAGKNRYWNKRSTVKELRARWESHCNNFLVEHGFEPRMDLRSNLEKGLDQAEPKIGPEKRQGDKWRNQRKSEVAELRELNASLRGVKSQINQKEKPNEQRLGRHGRSPQQPTHTRRRSAGATTQRAFERWHDSSGDRPGLRSSRRAGPERMPVLREQGVGAGQQEARDVVLQRTVSGPGGRDRGLHGVSGGGLYAVEALDRRQLYKARILQQQYQQEIQSALAARLAYVDRQPDRIAITLKGGGSVTDHGDRLLTKTGRDQEILAALALAKAKGWKQIQITGTEAFKARAYVEAVRAGLAVVGYEPAPELRAQLEKEKTTMTDQAGAGGMMALTPDVTAGQQALPASRWLDPLRAAREKLEAEHKAAKEKLDALPAAADIKKVEQELAVALGGQRYLDTRRKFREAAAAAKDAGALTRSRAEAKKEEAWQALLALHDKVLAEPGAAKHLAYVRQKNQEREQLTATLIPLQLGIGEIEYLEREIHKGSNPEPEFTKTWQRRKQYPLKLWQELALAPVFEAEATKERARLQAEADAENQVKQIQRNEQIQRELAAQQQADAIQDQLGKPGLTTEQEEALEQQRRYYLALADGHDEEEAKERAAKKSNALRL